MIEVDLVNYNSHLALTNSNSCCQGIPVKIQLIDTKSLVSVKICIKNDCWSGDLSLLSSLLCSKTTSMTVSAQVTRVKRA